MIRRSRAFPSLSSLLLPCLLGAASAGSATWNLTSIEDTRGASTSSMRFDAAGRPAIAFGTDDLEYATFNGGGWTFQTVATSCGGDRGASLAFDAGGNPAISFHDDVFVLQLARFDGAAWTSEKVDATVEVDDRTSLVFDRAGDPAIAYFDRTDGDLRYASFDGSSWTITTVDGQPGEVGEFPSLALDAAGLPAISYFDLANLDLKLARFDGSAWKVETVDSTGDVGQWTSLAFDPAGNPAISSVDGADIFYRHWNGTAWDAEPVGFTGNAAGTSLAFDLSGNPVMAYYSEGGGMYEVDFVRRGATGWSGVTVDAQYRCGLYPALALDAAGNPGVSYRDADNGTLKFARWNGTGFVPEHVRGDGPEGGVSIDIDATGLPSVSYFDGTVEGLRYARYDGAAWTPESVDPSFWVGSDSSLRFDAAGKPLIAYDDRGSGKLKLARRNGASWTLEVVDSGAIDPTAPMAASLALDPAGNPAIAYRFFGASAFGLKLARWDGSSWQIQTVDPNADLEFYASRALAFDVAGNPAIVYHTGGGISYASWNGASWDIQQVKASNAVSPSLAFDGAGKPVIAFTGTGAPQPMVDVARRPAATWNIETIALGSASGVAIDPSGNPAVAYSNLPTQEARLAVWDGTTWVIETITGGARSSGALAMDGSGAVAAVYQSVGACRAPEVAIRAGTAPAASVYREKVVSFAPGWQAAALPLTSLNDDPTPPFPAAVSVPGTLADAAPPAAELVLYRVLLAGDVEIGNTLSAVKAAPGVQLAF